MEKLGVRTAFEFWGRVCVGVGLVVLIGLAILRVTNSLIDWTERFEPFTFGAGLIVVVVALGPYLATLNQLKGVKQIYATVQKGPSVSSQRRNIYLAVGIVIGTALAISLVSSRSFTIWLSFGCLPLLMGLIALYLGWSIGRLERAARITIYMEDPAWKFDQTSYIGVKQGSPEPPTRRP